MTRERGTGSLRLRGRIWWCKYYHHGRPIEISCNTDDANKAKKVLKHKLAEVETGTYSDSRNITYESLRQSYYLDYEAQNRKSLLRDEEGNVYTDAVRRLDSFFAGYRATEIDTDQIKRFQREQRETGMSNGSINRSVSALRRAFRIARQDGKLRNLPYFPMLKESAPRRGFFEKADYEALASALPDYARLPLALGFFTGMRKSEVLNLRWEQVDFLREAITLYSGETKNDSGRVIPVAPQLELLLRDRYIHRQSSCPYVCYRLDRRGCAVRIRGFRRVWESRCVQLGLGSIVPQTDEATGEPLYGEPRPDRKSAKAKVKMVYVGKTFHDLRRSAVRFLVRAGVPEKVAMSISGHKTRNVFDRYNIVSDADLAVARSKQAAYYDAEKVGDNTGTVLHKDGAVISVTQ
jgi:integrase